MSTKGMVLCEPNVVVERACISDRVNLITSSDGIIKLDDDDFQGSIRMLLEYKMEDFGNFVPSLVNIDFEITRIIINVSGDEKGLISDVHRVLCDLFNFYGKKYKYLWGCNTYTSETVTVDIFLLG